MRTSPRSLLCSRSGEHAFITTGNPAAAAAFTASAGE